MTYYIGGTISIFDTPLTKDIPPTMQIFETQEIPEFQPTLYYKNKIAISDFLTLPETANVFNHGGSNSDFMNKDIVLWYFYMEDY